MKPENARGTVLDLRNFTSRKVKGSAETLPDTIGAWMERYLDLAVRGVRSEAVAQKIVLHLDRFRTFFIDSYGHERIDACLPRDVAAWQRYLTGQMAASTVNGHLASLSAWATWVTARAPEIWAAGDPTKGIGELGLPPLEPRALSEDQVRSLKNLCDRLGRFHQLKGRRRQEISTHAHARPLRDRAIVFVLLSTGLRREELVRLDLDQVEPCLPEELRRARKVRITRVKGKGKTERVVYLSADARMALADYLERERIQDAPTEGGPLFVSAAGIPARSADGRLSPRSINTILEQIGRWHDSEQKDPARQISPLKPHDLRHSFAFALARATGADPYELQRRLGHRSQRYIERYTNPPEEVAARYVEDF